MSTVAILGAGDLGAALAQSLASRGRVSAIRLIDENAELAAGKGLDIQQAGPVERYETHLSASSDVLAASGAAVIVIADDSARGEWTGDAGLALIRQLITAGTRAPLVFAGSNQTPLMEMAARELEIDADRMIGTAASAMVGVARSLVALDSGGSTRDVHVVVTGRPPAFVVAWSSATIAGMPVVERVAAHRLVALAGATVSLWPPGPRAIASASAPIVEALIFGSRQLHQAAAIIDGSVGARGVAAMMPLELRRGGISQRVAPKFSALERVELENSIARLRQR